MVLHLSTPPRMSARSLLKTLMRKIFFPSSRRVLASLVHRVLLLAIAGFLLVELWLLSSAWTSGHIQCECGYNVSTGEREARYLLQIMQEADPRSNKTTLQSLQEEHPSLAVEFLLREELRGWRCGVVPGLFTIKHNNGFWQQARVRSYSYLLFSAHWDDRDGTAMVRVLSVADTASPATPWCLFHLKGALAPIATRAKRVDFLHWQYPLEGFWHPFLISCSAGTARPIAVSVVEGACLLPTNALIISGPPTDLEGLGPQLMRTLDRNSASVNWDSSDTLKDEGGPRILGLRNQGFESSLEKRRSFKNFGVKSEQENGVQIETNLKHGNLPMHSKNEGDIQRKGEHVLETRLGSEMLPDGRINSKESVKGEQVHQSQTNSKLNLPENQKNNEMVQLPFATGILKGKVSNRTRYFQHKNIESGREGKKNLALCHKFLFNENKDDSVRLIEWLEAARAWGVDDVTMYVHSVHDNVRRVLRRYQKQGFLTVVPWTNPGHYPNSPALQRALYDTQRYVLFTLENIPYTDCLLRHVNTHRYVAVWDMDEFLLPAAPYASIPEMLDNAKLRWFKSHSDKCLNHFYDNANFAHLDESFKNSLDSSSILRLVDYPKKEAFPPECLPPVSYLAQCSYFFDDLSEPPDNVTADLHMLRHVTRTFKVTKPRVFTKAVHDTSRAMGLHAHFALYSTAGPVDRQRDLYDLYPSDEGFLAHYRSKCQGESQTECDELFRPHLQRDERMWRHKEQISEFSKAAIAALHLKP